MSSDQQSTKRQKNQVQSAAASMPLQVEYITETTPNDVLLGRGSHLVRYKGNIAFRRLVLTRRDEYIFAANLSEKEAVAQEVIDITHSKNGRFLRTVKDEDERRRLNIPNNVKTAWVPANHETVLEKVKQAFRDSCKDDATIMNQRQELSTQATISTTTNNNNNNNRISAVDRQSLLTSSMEQSYVPSELQSSVGNNNNNNTSSEAKLEMSPPQPSISNLLQLPHRSYQQSSRPLPISRQMLLSQMSSQQIHSLQRQYEQQHLQQQRNSLMLQQLQASLLHPDDNILTSSFAHGITAASALPPNPLMAASYNNSNLPSVNLNNITRTMTASDTIGHDPALQQSILRQRYSSSSMSSIPLSSNTSGSSRVSLAAMEEQLWMLDRYRFLSATDDLIANSNIIRSNDPRTIPRTIRGQPIQQISSNLQQQPQVVPIDLLRRRVEEYNDRNPSSSSLSSSSAAAAAALLLDRHPLSIGSNNINTLMNDRLDDIRSIAAIEGLRHRSYSIESLDLPLTRHQHWRNRLQQQQQQVLGSGTQNSTVSSASTSNNHNMDFLETTTTTTTTTTRTATTRAATAEDTHQTTNVLSSLSRQPTTQAQHEQQEFAMSAGAVGESAATAAATAASSLENKDDDSDGSNP